MPKITVDPEKCTKDGICSRVCVRRIITKPDKAHHPEIIPELADFCILCGHCVAACPTGALDHDLVSLADCQDVKSHLQPGPDSVEALLKTRRSIRRFKETPVPREMFDRLMEAARYAPTGSNRQDCQFLICGDRDRLKKMAGMVIDSMRFKVEAGKAGDNEERLKRTISGWEQGYDTILHNAPAIIVAHSNTVASPSQTNGIIAMTYVELAAHSLGLGACYCGFFNTGVKEWPPLREELGLPEGHDPAMTLFLGYPDVRYRRVPPRNQARVRYVGTSQ